MRKSLWGLIILLQLACVRDMAEIREDDLSPLQLSSEAAPGSWAQIGTSIVHSDPSTGNPALDRISIPPGQNLILSCDLAFGPGAAAGIFFRAAQLNARFASGYLLRIHSQGLDLWRLDGAMTVPLERFVRPLDPQKPHGLRVAAQGDKIAVELDGEAAFKVRDRTPLTGGEAGLYAKGACRFNQIKLEKP